MSEHVNYPHEPGRLYDCPACEAQCHCTYGDEECVFEGTHKVPLFGPFSQIKQDRPLAWGGS